MAEELVRLSAQNEVLSQQVKNIPQLEKELKVHILLQYSGTSLFQTPFWDKSKCPD